MSKIEEDRKVWEGKSDEWLYERLSNELTDKVAEIHKLIEELKLVKNNVDLANVRQRLCTNCHYCIPNERSRYHYDRYFCTLDKNKVTISSPENYNCYGHKFNEA